MRKFFNIPKWLLLILCLFISTESFAQVNPDSIYYKKLYYLCKAWGHAKYHHTEIAKGNVNWDFELLKTIIYIRNVYSNDDFNLYVEMMLNSAGEMGISNVELPSIVDSLKTNLEISWIYDKIFSGPVSSILDTIMHRFRPQSNVYVKESLPYMYHSFEDDNLYHADEIDYPNQERRLLALFRYWNIIHYFFPYKEIMDQHWDSTLVEFIPKIVKAYNALSYHLSFKELTTRLNDSHAIFSSPTYREWGGYATTPFALRFIEEETVISNIADSIRPVKIGDVIKEIDGEDIYELRKRLRKYAYGSNEVWKEHIINKYIAQGRPGPFNIKLYNGKEVYSTTLDRGSGIPGFWTDDNRPEWRSLTTDDGCLVGIVNMGKLEPEHVSQMFSELGRADALIFDVRNYPKGSIYNITDYLFPSSVITMKWAVPDVTYPGTFYWLEEIMGNNSMNTYFGQIVILFDERTLSHAEMTCMALEQFPGAVKIGSSTGAADGNISKIFLPGKIQTNATFIGTFYPDFRPTQRVGIVPNIEVLPTIEGLRNGKDEVLEAAFEYLGCNMVTHLDQTNLPVENEFKISPNPAKEYLSYELEGIIQNQEIILKIFDTQGRFIKQIETYQKNGEINVSELNRGIYILKIQFNELIISRIFIKT